MCGIAGILRIDNRSVDERHLREMTAAMAHRGPDHQAVMVAGPIGLGHTRLSIIDVTASANQPMLSDDGRYAIVFNGEIYNFREIRRRLEHEGVIFRTASDTEVLLKAFLTWRFDCFRELNGMFAFAIADLQENEVTLVRDRFGIKPLYFVKANGVFMFASEVKALIRATDKAFSIDTLKLLELLLYRELIEGTFFREVRALEPGSYIRIRQCGSSIHEVQWFTVSDLVDEAMAATLRGETYERRLERVDLALKASVERHLVSDVPVGTLCSGGTDSSLLTALSRQINPNVAVYHVDVEGNSERRWADAVAKHLGIEMFHVVLTKDNFLLNYVDCIFFNDFPLTHPNGVAVFLISQIARRNGCKVLLTGEGADESLGGYDWRYRNRLRYEALQRFANWPKRAMSRFTYLLSDVWTKDFDPNFGFQSRTRIADAVSLCSDKGFRMRHWDECFRRLRRSMSDAEARIQASLVCDLRDYISGILHRQDRSSMQASIESRVPFLDHTLAYVAVNLPLCDKVTWRADKPLLKDLASRYLPREVVFRKKVGFGTPSEVYAKQIDTSMFENGFLEETFGMSASQLTGLVTTDFGTYGHQLIGLELWGRMFVLGQDRDWLRERFACTAGASG